MTQTTSELVHAAVGGDRAAFERLVREHSGLVSGIAYSVCGDFTLTEDISQEAFIEAWKNLASLQQPERFAGWICTIAQRRAIDAVRSAEAARTESSLDKLPFDIHDPKQLTAEANMAQDQQREWVWSMLAQLPDIYREPMILFYRSQESTRAVAAALGESEATIRQRLKRGRDMLRAEMTASIRSTLEATAPSAAFAAVVMAALPPLPVSTTAAAVALGKASNPLGGAASTAMGTAATGAAVGIAGGILGTYLGWKNCEYDSQQRFMLRQARVFAAGLTIFASLLAILVASRSYGVITNGAWYGGLLASLILVSQACSVAWIWYGIYRYKRLAQVDHARGELRRPVMQQRLEFLRRQTQVKHADGSVTYEAFRWNAGGWFGSCLGSLAWLIPLAVSALWYGSTGLAIVAGGALLCGVLFALLVWRFRQRWDAYWAYLVMLLVVGTLTAAVMAGIEFLANAAMKQFVQWTPWAWCLLALFPLLAVQLRALRQSFQRTLQAEKAAVD